MIKLPFWQRIAAIFFFMGFATYINSQNKTVKVDSRTTLLTLDECVNLAVNNNELIKTSMLDIKIAESQNEQAKSANYPTLNLSSKLAWLDEDPNYIFPSFEFDMSGINLGALNLNIPPITVPQQNIKLMDKFIVESELRLIYPLFTGGKISALQNQARKNIEVAKHGFAGVESELIYNTSKVYNAIVMLKNLLRIGDNTIIRLEATLSLTESLYKKGSGSVTKLDYLKNKMMVHTVKGIVETVRSKYKSAKETLRFLIGYDNGADFEPADDSLNYSRFNRSFEEVKEYVLSSNTDLKRINSAISIYNEKVSEARSEYWPNIALFGFYKRTENNYHYGYVTNDNKNQFGVGIGLELPVFEGFRTVNKIEQAEIELDKLEHNKKLLLNSILMEINKLEEELNSAYARVEYVKEAKLTAEENQDLTKRAYQNDMAPIEDYIQSQIMESFAEAQYNLAVFDLIDLHLRLEKLADTKFGKTE